MEAIVVIPTYNEKQNIFPLTQEIVGVDRNLHILFVDDNSPDGTGQVADELTRKYSQVHVIHRKAKLGLGPAYIEGFRYALKNGFEYICGMDADFSHQPKYLKSFLEKIKDYDLVVGSRYLQGVSVLNWPLQRIILSSFANRYVRAITRLPLTDCTSGFECFRRNVLESIGLDNISSQGYGFMFEIKYRVFKKKFKITEIPIIFIERREGVTKLSFKVIAEAALMPWKLYFGLYR